MSSLVELSRSRELMLNLTLRELRGKYKRSLLGWTWSLINPLATMLIFTIVFHTILKIEPPTGRPSGLHTFELWLLCGLLPWNFLANGLTGGMGSLIGNANLIKKVYFPREILVASNVASWSFSLVIELGVLAVVLLIAGNFVFPWLPAVVLIVVVQSLFVTGVALLLGVVNVYFRDVQHFVAIFLQLWFYLTPIIYPIDRVPAHLSVLGFTVPARHLLSLNPMTRFVGAYRDCLYDLRVPPASDVVFLVVSSCVVLLVGMWTFSRLEPRLAEEL